MKSEAVDVPAFPLPLKDSEGYIEEMSLRDWFAGQAIASFAKDNASHDISYIRQANDAYKIADCLLEVRAGKPRKIAHDV